jgi:hypothetical protein
MPLARRRTGPVFYERAMEPIEFDDNLFEAGMGGGKVNAEEIQ